MNETGTGHTAVERTSERELVVSRRFDAPPRDLYQAWTKPELFILWWAPASMGVPLVSCAMDARPGGGYRLAYGPDPASAMAFFGTYLEVIPDERLVWTNEETDGAPVTTVTFEARGAGTLVSLRERHPTAEALDEAFAGMQACAPEQFDQLAALLAGRAAEAG